MPRELKPTDEPSGDVVQRKPDAPKVGVTVICTNRLPSPLKPWEHPIWIGVIEEPGSDPSRWNGRYSEAAYCVHTRKVKVRYTNPDLPTDSFTQHDKVESLIVLSEEEAKLSGIEAI